MGKYGICFDGELRYFVVVEYHNPENPVTGDIVHRTYTEDEAKTWIEARLTNQI